mmetsp:Transcript_7020/g.21055  ORF Transcript_7020/g.21055 Transcript_7020/m.21055 type:complete len:365 (-) Transcript_7020:268-1362(-)
MKPRVGASLVGTHAHLGVHRKQALQQVHTRIRNWVLGIPAHGLLEGVPEVLTAFLRDAVPQREVLHAGPLPVRGLAEHVKDLVDLVTLLLARQQWRLQQELGQNATGGPHVHRLAVHRPEVLALAVVAQEELGWPVPKCDDLWRHPRLVSHLPGQPEVSQLHVPLVIHQDVAALEVPAKGKEEEVRRVSPFALRHSAAAAVIPDYGCACFISPVDDPVLVAGVQARQNLPHHQLDHLQVHVARLVIPHPGQVVLHVLKHHVDSTLVVVLARSLARHDLLQVHHEVVVPHVPLSQPLASLPVIRKLRQQLDLPYGCNRKPLFLVIHTKLFCGHQAPVVFVLHLVHLAVHALADLTYLRVTLLQRP